MEIKHVREHYELYISGKFEGSYDTFKEAADAWEDYRKEKENEENV